MERVEILVEEKSMQAVLEIILPKILANKWILDENYFIRSHEGKTDLKKSIPSKVKVFSNYHTPAGVIVIQDQDSNDCKLLKTELFNLCRQHGQCPILIRIVCKELESWYLGDMNAIKQAYPKFKAEQHSLKSKFKNPDSIVNASKELEKILPEFQKVTSARNIAPYLDINGNNKSISFAQFISGVKLFFGN